MSIFKVEVLSREEAHFQAVKGEFNNIYPLIPSSRDVDVREWRAFREQRWSDVVKTFAYVLKDGSLFNFTPQDIINGLPQTPDQQVK